MGPKTKKPSDADPSRVRRYFYRDGPYGEEEYVLEASSLVWDEYDSVKARLTLALKEVETLKAERTSLQAKRAEAVEMLRSVTEALEERVSGDASDADDTDALVIVDVFLAQARTAALAARAFLRALALDRPRSGDLEHGPYCTKFELRDGQRVFCAELAGHADACEFARGGVAP